MAATSEQRRAAVVRRLKAEGPQPRPVFRSGVDIDAVHYRMHPPPKVAAPDDRPLGQTAGAEPEKSEG